jgi:small subunit ribosomal protein S16
MRTGKKGESKYRLVVKERRDKRDGRALEYLGSYEKRVGGKEVKALDMDRIKYWTSKGAQLTPTVKKITGL